MIRRPHRSMRATRALASALLAFAIPSSSRAQVEAEPLGGQFQVNLWTGEYQGEPDVTAHPDGGFAIVWSVSQSPASRLEGQRWGADGQPAAPFMILNAYTGRSPMRPRIQAHPDGDVTVAWQEGIVGTSIRARRFDASMAPRTDVVVLSAERGSDPQMAPLPDGELLVVWESESSSGGDTSSRSVQAQRMSDVGATIGTPFQVNAYTTGRQSAVTVAPTDDGALVMWDSLNKVSARALAADGTPLASEVDLTAYGIGSDGGPHLADPGPEGQRLLWSNEPTLELLSTRVDATGEPFGEELAVNETSPSSRYFATARTADGDLFAVWAAMVPDDDATDSLEIRGRVVTSDGQGAGAEFQVNTYTRDVQYRPAVATATDGTVLVVWASDGSVGTDDAGLSVQGRRYGLVFPLFRDDFEDGDLAGWSGVVP